MEHLTQAESSDGAHVDVRYWAGAEAAAGCTTESLRCHPSDAAPLGADLRRAIVSAHPGIEAVLARCSLLQGGRRVDDATRLTPGEQVEVLPPFVGG